MGNVPWAGGRKGRGGQASGDEAGVVGRNKRWASPFRTMAILRAQALLMPLLTLPSGSRWGQESRVDKAGEREMG